MSVQSTQSGCGSNYPIVKAGAISLLGTLGSIALRQFGFYRLSWGLVGTSLFLGGIIYARSLRAKTASQAPQTQRGSALKINYKNTRKEKFHGLFPGEHTNCLDYCFFRRGLTNGDFKHLNELLLQNPYPSHMPRERLVTVQFDDNPQLSSVEEIVSFVNGIGHPVELSLSETGFDLKAIVEISRQCEKLQKIEVSYKHIKTDDWMILHEIKDKNLIVYMKEDSPDVAKTIVQLLGEAESTVSIDFVNDHHETVVCYPKSAFKPRTFEQPNTPGVTGAIFVDKKDKK